MKTHFLIIIVTSLTCVAAGGALYSVSLPFAASVAAIGICGVFYFLGCGLRGEVRRDPPR